MRAEGSGEPQSEEETDELAAVALWGGTRQPPPSQAACAHNLKLPQHGHPPPRAAASGARIALRLHKTIEPSPPGLELGLKGAAAVTLDEAWLDLMRSGAVDARGHSLTYLSLSPSSQLGLRELGCESGWDHRPNHALIYCRHFLGNRTSSPTSSGTLKESPNDGTQFNYFHR